ncbi:MAG TPA: amidohydrolase family protein [Dermatophilaceae bacterium]|nr:amidohydrolase family protein [Dermatophilaceae bacterium]
MSIYDEPKVDCHHHVFDPARFPYAADAAYRPAGQEIGTAAQLLAVFDAYGVRHGLVVGPNSGYGEDNRCLLDVLDLGGGRLKGAAVVHNDVSREELKRLRQAGVLGITFNAAALGLDYYDDTAALLGMLADLGMFVDVQVEADQMVALAPMLLRSEVQVLVDHCGRPRPEAGLGQPGFQTLLRLGRTGRVAVKLSGMIKFSNQAYPFRDTWPFVAALVDGFGYDALLWGSDWPFLRSPVRVDYGPLLLLAELLAPDPGDRRKLMWETPRRLFGF